MRVIDLIPSKAASWSRETIPKRRAVRGASLSRSVSTSRRVRLTFVSETPIALRVLTLARRIHLVGLSDLVFASGHKRSPPLLDLRVDLFSRRTEPQALGSALFDFLARRLPACRKYPEQDHGFATDFDQCLAYWQFR